LRGHAIAKTEDTVHRNLLLGLATRELAGAQQQEIELIREKPGPA
jgi:hypothetical protein